MSVIVVRSMILLKQVPGVSISASSLARKAPLKVMLNYKSSISSYVLNYGQFENPSYSKLGGFDVA